MMALATWLAGSKFGRATLAVGVTVLLVLYLLLTSYRKGIDAEKAKQIAASLDALRKRVSVDDKVSKLPPTERRAELDRWMRD